MKSSYTFREISEMQKWPLDKKIETTLRVIANGMQLCQSRAAIAFSGGKDSTVLWHLIRMNFPEQHSNTAIIFGNTGVEFPESLKFARELGKMWGEGNFYETKLSRLKSDELKYDAQVEVLKWLVERDSLTDVLTPYGKLKRTDILMRVCPPEMLKSFYARGLIWKKGTAMNYLWCCDQYGYPILGKSFSKLQAHRINIDCFLNFSKTKSDKPELIKYYDLLRRVKISQACCTILKKTPSENMQAHLKVDVIFKGLMAAESRTRKINFASRGFIFQSERRYLDTPFYHVNPLSHWTDEDIWAYIHKYNVPYSPLYDMEYTKSDGTTACIERNGCIGCFTDFGRRDSHMSILRQTHPNLWTWVMRHGMAEQLARIRTTNTKYRKSSVLDATTTCKTDEEYDQIIQWAIENRPCAFD